ncbi:response regulator transcription factor [Rhizobium sp. R693]|uniref:LuxR C-terminal-related transcriptional regulator n=1 Tax=Rhizobium sp. R693 TaxID=1764276 RepID=UPI001FDA4555|nr:response regulator transcription factor [Rhizobium sp. R693]
MSVVVNGNNPLQLHKTGRYHVISRTIKESLSAETHANTLAIIDDRPLDRECLAKSLIAHGLDLDVRLFASINDWVKLPEHDFAGILINIGHSELSERKMVDEIRQLADRFPNIPVVILSKNHDLRQVLLALEAGVKGYIPSTVALPVYVEAIGLALAGGVFISAESLTDLHKLVANVEHKERQRAQLFTPREEEVIDALRRGRPNKIIAYELNLRESTVKVHVRNIMKKLNASNRTEVMFKLGDLFN